MTAVGENLRGTSAAPTRLPRAALIVMSLAAFIMIATETMPAGLLPQIASGLDVSEGGAGQFISAYTLGTVVATIPAITLTRGLPRKPLMLIGLAGFLVANTATAMSTDLVFALIVRFIAGAFSGLVWGVLAGYARKIAPPELAGRAVAIAMTGTPVGLAVGTPLGSWLGATLEWRWSFVGMSAFLIMCIIATVFIVPGAAGQSEESRLSVVRITLIPGVAAILAVILLWMLSHSTMYTYVGTYLRASTSGLSVDVALVAFGMSAMVGIWITGLLVDRALRPLIVGSVSAFIVAGIVFVMGHQFIVAVILAIIIWGIAFGGAATQLLTALAQASGENVDVANSLLAVSFNLAIFGAGVIGALLIGSFGGLSLPTFMVALAASALTVVVIARRAAFPPGR